MKKEIYEVKEYLSKEYYTFLEQKIAENTVVCINGDTGCGKTVFIKEYAQKHNGIIAVPFLSTRKLYSPINVIDGENKNEFYDGKACVMVYDRLAMINDELLKDRVILVDEAHILFMDRTYRESLTKLFEKLKRTKSKIVLITASPTGEIKKLGCENIYRFYKKREHIKLKWIKSKNPSGLIDEILKKTEDMGTFDRIIIFSDMYARVLYDTMSTKLLNNLKENVSILHSDYKNTGDLDRITTNELLDTPITICTSLAFNGLNFKNENEKILVIVDFKIGDDAACKIIQCVGRVRNSKVTAIVIANDYGAKTNVDQRRNIAQSYVDAGAPHGLFSYNESLLKSSNYNANIEIEEYINSQTEETITQELQETGYIDVEISATEEKTIKKRGRNELKDKMSAEIIAQIYEESTLSRSKKIEEKEITDENKNAEKYYKDMLGKLNNTIKKRNLNVGMIRQIFEYEEIEHNGKKIKVYPLNKKILITTLAENINYIFDAIEFDRSIDDLEDDLQKSWKKYNFCDEIEIKRQKTQLSKLRKYQDRYKHIAQESVAKCPALKNGYCKTRVLLEYRKHLIENEIKHLDSKNKNKKKKVEIEGKIYDSIDEAAQAYEKKRLTIHRWLKCDKAKYME